MNRSGSVEPESALVGIRTELKLSIEPTARVAAAIAYATRVHRGQTRHGRPYADHLLRVAALVLEDGGSEDETIGALLHDAAEDHGGHRRLDDIRRRFGDAVAAIVDACTDSYEEPTPPWRIRKEQYLEHLPDASPSALRVSLADKVDNVRAILREPDAHTDPAQARRRSRPLDEPPCQPEDLCWYYASLARLYARLRPGPRADELARLASELRRRSTAERVSNPSVRATRRPRTDGGASERRGDEVASRRATLSRDSASTPAGEDPRHPGRRG